MIAIGRTRFKKRNGTAIYLNNTSDREYQGMYNNTNYGHNYTTQNYGVQQQTKTSNINSYQEYQNKLEKQNKDASEKRNEFNRFGINGLCNMGNTCYFNSIVQCLNSIPELYVYFSDMYDQNNGDNSEYTYNM